MTFYGLPLALIAVLALPLPAVAGPITVVPGADFKGVGAQLGSSGKFFAFAAPRDVGGKLAICGLVYYEKANSTTKALERRFTEHMQFKLAGKPVRANPDQFLRYASQDQAVKANKAGCSVTTQAWDASYAKAAFTVDLPSETITY